MTRDRLDLDAVAAHEPTAASGDDEAAVLVPVIRAAAGDEILFTERPEYLSSHPGQMSFPGGGREPADADLRETALREAREEVGLAREEVDVVGRLDDYPSHFGTLVRPFVATVPDRAYTETNAEVARVVRESVAHLADPASYEPECRDLPERGPVRFHVFALREGAVVWGLTAEILAELLERAAGWEPDAEPREVDHEEPWPHER